MNTKLVFNFLGIDFESNLGVAKYAATLISHLHSEFSIVAMVDNPERIEQTDTGRLLVESTDRVLGLSDAKLLVSKESQDTVEILIHHFKLPTLGLPSIVICHDLHVFDIPWKYKDRRRAVSNFRNSVTSSKAVVCHFPRTYYRIEKSIASILPNLFLVPTVDLHQTLPASGEEIQTVAAKYGLATGESHITNLLFPAQLQAHKGHRQIISALAAIGNSGRRIRLLFPGSDFDRELTAELKEFSRASGVLPQTIFLGRISDHDLSCLYQFSDGVIVPSLAEGGAFVPLEGISYGKPVAVNRIEAAEMHLKMHGVKVKWFSSLTLESVVEALLYLSDDTVRCKLSEANMHIVRSLVNPPRDNLLQDCWRRIIAFVIGKGARPLVAVSSNYRVAYYG